MDLAEIKKIYFVGIGGIAMSAVAGLAKRLGYAVSGSDSSEIYSPAKDVLDEEQIQYTKNYSSKNIEQDSADLYVISAGLDAENPEIKYILEKKFPTITFPELLYELNEDKLRLVVAGTHGKSTTTGLLGHLLKNLDDSSFITGAVLQNYNTNFHYGDGHYAVFEGDEYKSSFEDPTPKFHYYKPDILVLTNLEYDHPDLFASLEDLEYEFNELIEKMPDDGLIVYNADDALLSKLVHRSNVSSVSFGIENEADFKAELVDYGAEYTTIQIMNKFSKQISSKLLGQTEEYKTQLPGKINVYNSLAAIATVRALGFSQQDIALDLLTYQGVKRRFEAVGVKNGVTIIDDYAHHPTAVRETLEAARLRYPKAKIWAVFEPHTFSRTKATLPDLVKCFDSADEVLISEIYPARENRAQATITSESVVQAIGLHHKHVHLVYSKQEALDTIKKQSKSGDVVIVMAVGSFNRLAYELKELL